MKLTPFLSFILVLALGWMQFYASVREQFNGVSEAKQTAQRTHEKLQRERLAWNLERDQFLEFRQDVATLMPDVLKEKGQGEAGYPYRNLASILTKSEANKVRELVAKTMFERGKEYFRNKQYEKSERLFTQLIEKFSYSSYVTESYFLLAEGYFQSGNLEESTRTIQNMMEQFPGHELTGFSLIRMGRIFEAQNRTEEAIDIYKTVLRSFPQRDVASQARGSLKGIDL